MKAYTEDTPTTPTKSALSKFVTPAAVSFAALAIFGPAACVNSQATAWPERPTSPDQIDNYLIDLAQHYCAEGLPLTPEELDKIVTGTIVIGAVQGISTEVSYTSAMEGCHRAEELADDTADIYRELAIAFRKQSNRFPNTDDGFGLNQD